MFNNFNFEKCNRLKEVNFFRRGVRINAISTFYLEKQNDDFRSYTWKNAERFLTKQNFEIVLPQQISWLILFLFLFFWTLAKWLATPLIFPKLFTSRERTYKSRDKYLVTKSFGLVTKLTILKHKLSLLDVMYFLWRLC